MAGSVRVRGIILRDEPSWTRDDEAMGCARAAVRMDICPNDEVSAEMALRASMVSVE